MTVDGSTLGELDARLANLLVDELRKQHSHMSWSRFGGRLRLPHIALGESRRVLGQWSSETRTIEMSRYLVLEQPWAHVEEVLAHEMAHQYVDEVLRVDDEPPHGPTFRRVCKERGIDPAATARTVPDAERAEDPRTGKLREKVRRLLALASSDNQHEAELAMIRARELLSRHEIELGLEGVERGHVVRRLGRGKRRLEAWESTLGVLLEKHFRVKVIQLEDYDVAAGHRVRALEVMGTPANVEMAEYVHAFLVRTVEGLWTARRRQIGGRRRNAFMHGAMRGFREKLDSQAVAVPPPAKTGEKDHALVLREEKARLADYVRRRYPRLRSAGGSSTVHAAAFHAGREEGRRIVLHQPLGGSARDRGRRLGSGD